MKNEKETVLTQLLLHGEPPLFSSPGHHPVPGSMPSKGSEFQLLHMEHSLVVYHAEIDLAAIKFTVSDTFR